MYQDELFKDSQQTTMAETSTEFSELPSQTEDILSELEPQDEIMFGVVANCVKLNVRAEPRADATIVCEVVCQAELMIDESESTEEFFKVCTTAGIEGFCMKKFIEVQP
jgi:hypothetical protein|nr:MAG TPA: hypothetical protein [Caudoviricetes sp.]